MSLKPLKYKNFTWPNNPSEYNVSYDKKIVTHSYPEINASEQEELGTNSRIVTGSGVFFGKNAYDNFKKLEKVFKEKTPGKLVHPKWASMNANFTKLSLKEEPTPNFIAYNFEFVEYVKINAVNKIVPAPKPKPKPTPKKPTKYHTVKKGDTLWAISKIYYKDPLKWRKIADANKKLIKNPNLIYPGWKLIIP